MKAANIDRNVANVQNFKNHASGDRLVARQ